MDMAPVGEFQRNDKAITRATIGRECYVWMNVGLDKQSFSTHLGDRVQIENLASRHLRIRWHRLERSTGIYPPPFTRRHTHELPKQSREMRLIAHSAIKRDLAKGMVGC